MFNRAQRSPFVCTGTYKTHAGTPALRTFTTLQGYGRAPEPSPWECEVFCRKVGQGRRGGDNSNNNCPPRANCLWASAICRLPGWSGPHISCCLCCYIHIVCRRLARYHPPTPPPHGTVSHTHTPVNPYLLSYVTEGVQQAWVSLDRWLPLKSPVGEWGGGGGEGESGLEPGDAA